MPAGGGIEQAAELAQQGLLADKLAQQQQPQPKQQREGGDLLQQEDELLAAQAVQDHPGKEDDTLLQAVPIVTGAQVSC